jgi:two-component system, LytTR family, sensor kinase
MRNWPGPPFSETISDVLLLHTLGTAAQLAVTLILLRALYLLRRSGETPQGFVAIAILMLLGSVARAARLLVSWISLKHPYWLDGATIAVLFITIISVPVILSAHYLPASREKGPKRVRQEWLQWAMMANAICGCVAFVLALSEHARGFIQLSTSIACTVSAVLLLVRASMFENLQLRQRGLLLFAGLTTAGLLGVSVILLGGIWLNASLGSSVGATACIELCYVLVVLGMMFVFASVRLADIIVKRVLSLYIWTGVSVLLWAATRELDAAVTGTTHQEAAVALLSIALIGAALALTPIAVQRIDGWVGAWVFQVQDREAAIQAFWEQLLELENGVEVYRAGEQMIRSTLSLAAARIARLADLRPSGITLPLIGPSPRFLPPDSPLRSLFTPPADVLLPLFQEGTPEHWIVLSNGVLRPPLTAMELNFVTRIAGAIQVRIATVLGEQRRLERLRREGAFREEIADAELRALRAQINPHFLFNSLNTIADLSVVAPEKAEEMTLRLAAVFRYVLANTERQFTSVKEEIDFARSYLGIEEARFGDRLKVQFDVEQSVMQERVPALLLQPLIENAIKHGLSPKRQGGTLSIGAKRTALGFTLTVSDDGVGLRALQPGSQDNGTYVGLRNVEKRLRTAYEDRACFTLRPRDGGGTEAAIVIDRDQKEPA